MSSRRAGRVMGTLLKAILRDNPALARKPRGGRDLTPEQLARLMDEWGRKIAEHLDMGWPDE